MTKNAITEKPGGHTAHTHKSHRAIGAFPTELPDRDADWTIIEHALRSIEQVVRRHKAEIEVDGTARTIERAISRAGRAGIARSALLRKRGISSITARDFDTTINQLIGANIVRSKVPSVKGGRPGVRYFHGD